MRGVVIHGPGDVRLEERADPILEEATDAIIRLRATCVCGSDLWSYRGITPVDKLTLMGHEYCGIVEQVGSDVTTLTPGQFVVGSFFASDNTCENCRAGYQSSCLHGKLIEANGAQAELAGIDDALGDDVERDGSLVGSMSPEMRPT